MWVFGDLISSSPLEAFGQPTNLFVCVVSIVVFHCCYCLNVVCLFVTQICLFVCSVFVGLFVSVVFVCVVLFMFVVVVCCL